MIVTKAFARLVWRSEDVSDWVTRLFRKVFLLDGATSGACPPRVRPTQCLQNHVVADNLTQ